MFKQVILSLMVTFVFSVLVNSAVADVYVRGHLRSNGTYVPPHYRSNADSSFHNNWSTHPNINPYTGQIGTRRTPSYPKNPSFQNYAPRSSSFPSKSWSSLWK